MNKHLKNFIVFTLSKDTVKPCAENVAKIQNFPQPTKKRKIQQLLGLANFKWRFVVQYTSLTILLLTGVVDVARKLQLYCTGEVYFHTDHEPLKSIRNQRNPRDRYLLTIYLIGSS